MRTKLKGSMIVATLLSGALQLTVTTPRNPAMDDDDSAIEAHMRAPPQVTAIFKRSCDDCHSNRTAYPWYSRVAPASWLVARHVEDGRAELNFSEWGAYAGRMRETRLRSICWQVGHGAMPPASYRLLHPRAELTDDDVRAICAWAEEEVGRATVEEPQVRSLVR